MKWIVLFLPLGALPLAMSLSADEGTETSKPKKEIVNKKGPPPFDYDLFRRDEQVTSMNVEFLYWGVYEGDLDYSLSMENAAWGPDPSYAQGKFNSARYNWEPGVRIGFSYFRAPHYWEVIANYTRLTSRGKDSKGVPENPGAFLTGTWPQITTSPLTNAKSHIHLNYNMVDLLVTRVFYPNPHLRLRLKGGMAIAWMDQDWRIDYFDASRNGTFIRNEWRYIGAGLKTGTLLDWYWGNNVYMTGQGLFGAFMGGYWNKSFQKVNFQPSPLDNPQTPIRNAKLFDPQPAFIVQASLGPSWQKNFTCSRAEIFIGYELNIWWNIQQIFHSTSGSPSAAKETWINTSLIALQGLTTRFTMDF